MVQASTRETHLFSKKDTYGQKHLKHPCLLSQWGGFGYLFYGEKQPPVKSEKQQLKDLRLVSSGGQLPR